MAGANRIEDTSRFYRAEVIEPRAQAISLDSETLLAFHRLVPATRGEDVLHLTDEPCAHPS